MAHRKPWTPEDECILQELHSCHASPKEMALQLERSTAAVKQKVIHMGLGPLDARYWTADDVEKMQELWGTKTIPQIAKILGRSMNSIKVKSTRLGLGAFKHSSDYLTANQIAVLMGVDGHTVTDWWLPKLGLKSKKIAPLGGKTANYIKQSDLMLWLERHPSSWDSRRLEKFALGAEPEWLKQKRKRDAQAPAKRLQKWTAEEDQELISLFKPGNRTNRQIGDLLGRSASSVEHRLLRLDVWGTGKYVGQARQEVRKVKRQAKTRQDLIIRFRDALLYKRNQIAFDGYWQKEMCQHWDDFEGCTAGEANCDICASFQRLQPQYCRRCGSTVFERNPLPDRICQRCRKQRKAQYFRKMNAIGRGTKRTDDNEAI